MNITFHCECHLSSISSSTSLLLRADTASQATAGIPGAVNSVKYHLTWNSLLKYSWCFISEIQFLISGYFISLC